MLIVDIFKISSCYYHHVFLLWISPFVLIIWSCSNLIIKKKMFVRYFYLLILLSDNPLTWKNNNILYWAFQITSEVRSQMTNQWRGYKIFRHLNSKVILWRGRELLNVVIVMVSNDTFNNISVILWRQVLLVEETGEKQWPAASYWQNFIT